MNPKQKRFVEEYLIDRCPTHAAKRAGYNPRWAKNTGWRMLKDPEVRRAVADGLPGRGETGEITAERVRRELALIAFGSIGDYFHWGPDGVTVKDKTLLTPEQQAVVAEVSRSRTKTGETIRVKLHDKLAALDKLARHLGMYREPPEEHDDVAELSETERAQLVLALLARARARRLAQEAEAAEGCDESETESASQPGPEKGQVDRS